MPGRIVLKLCFGALLAVTLAVGLVSPAAAQNAGGGATVTPDNGAAGSSFTASAAGFKANSPVDVTVDGAVPTNGHTTADGSGNASATFTVAGLGIHQIRLVGVTAADQPRSSVGALTVQGALCTVNCSVGLPRTGGPTRMLTLVAGVLLIAGLYLYTRKRIAGRHFKGSVMRVSVFVIGAGLVLINIANGANTPGARAASTASISGKASTDGTTGVPDLCVVAANESAFGKATTAPDGTYTVTGLPPGNYNVGYVDCSATPTVAAGYYSGRTTWNSATAIPVADGEAVTAKDLFVTKKAVAVGRVTAATGGAAVPNVCVFMGTTNDALSCVATTLSSGVFYATGMSAGSYITAYRADPAANLAIRYHNNFSDSTGATPVVLTAGQETTGLGAALPASGTVTGTVTATNTGGAPNRRVCIADFSTNVPTLASSFAGTDGTFTIKQLSAGSHKFKFTDCEFDGSETPYVTEFYNDKTAVESADPVTVSEGGTQGSINAQMAGGGTATTPTTSSTVTSTTSSTSTTSTTAVTASTTTSSTTSSTIPESAPPANGPAQASTTTVTPGGTLTTSGGGFAPNSNVNAVIYSSPVLLKSATADALGNVTMTVTLPSNLATGTHQLQ
ncbi:MAG: hypothetical protein QOF21_3331, partial [Actinomycetota bacterium]